MVELDESLIGDRKRRSGKSGCAAQRKTLVAVSAHAEPTPQAAGELPWVQIVISNAKR